MTNDQELLITIRAKNLTASEFQKAREEISGLTDAASKGANQTRLSFDSLKNTMVGAFRDPMGAMRGLTTGVGDDLVAAAGAGAAGAVALAAALAAAGYAAFQLSSKAAAIGAELDDLSDITGMSVPALSELQYVANVTGTSFEQLTGGITMMQRRMQEKPEAFAQALQGIGLSLREIQQLKPEDQLTKIATAFRENTDATDRASTAVALFGRQGMTLIPTLTRDIEALRNESAALGLGWTQEQAAAAEEFEMAVNRLKIEFGHMFTVIGRELIPIMTVLVSATSSALHAFKSLGGYFTEIMAPLKIVIDGFKEWVTIAETLGAKQIKLPELVGAPAWRDSLKDLAINNPIQLTAQQEKAAIEEVDRVIAESRKKRADAEKDAKKKRDEFDKDYAKNTESVKKLEVAFKETSVRLQQMQNIQLTSQKTDLDRVKALLEVRNAVMEVEQATHIAQFGFKGLFQAIPGAPVIKPTVDELVRLGGIFDPKTIASFFQNDLGKIITGAFAGGGNIGSTIVSSLAGFLTDPTKGIGASLQQSIQGVFSDNGIGKHIGGFLSSMVPGVGSLIGGLIIPALGKIGAWVKDVFGGPSQAELDGRKLVREFEVFINGMLTGQQRLEAGGSKWRATVIAVRDAYRDAGYSAKEAEDAVRRMWEAEKQGPEAVKKIQEEMMAVFDQAKQDQEDLTAAVERYGFKIEELGPKFRQQKLDEQAILLMNDFRLLVGAGADVALVIERMADNINEFIATAIRSGGEVPAAMKPILEQMVLEGKLLDENGNKVEHLEDLNLTYSQTMTEGFDRVVDALNTLLEGLGLIPDKANAAAAALANMSANTAMQNAQNAIIAAGGNPPSFATEGFVRRPTLAVVGDNAEGELIVGPSTIFRFAQQSHHVGVETGRAQATRGNSSAAAADQMSRDIMDMRGDIAGMRGDMRMLGRTLARAVRDGMLEAA